MSNPSKTRAIAEAKVKTDKVDARILAQLLAADFLPPDWVADERTRMLRRQVMRRTHLVRQRTRVKNQVHAILARNLAPTPPVTDLFAGRAGAGSPRRSCPPMSGAPSTRWCASWTSTATSSRVDKGLAVEALDDPVVARLMTVPGIDVIVAVSIVAAVGDFSRFDDPNKLVAYLGLNPRVRQSGNRPGPRPDHQDRPRAGPRHARRSGLLGRAGAGPATRLLSARQGPPRIPDRHRRHRPQDDRALLAPHHQGRGLRLRPPRAGHATSDASSNSPPAHLTAREHRLPGADYHDKQRRNRKAPVEQAEHAYEVSSPTGNRNGQHLRDDQQRPPWWRWAPAPATGRGFGALRLSSAAALPVPVLCSSLGGQPAPTAADATAVLAAVKVVRPTGRSTLTAAGGRRSQAAAGRSDGPQERQMRPPLLTISSVLQMTRRISTS